MRPDTINILGREYNVLYFDKAAEVDERGVQSLWGQHVDRNSTIRICTAGGDDMVLHALIHESLHSIANQLHLTQITDLQDEEEIIDLLALALADMLTRNGWLKDSQP